MTNEKLRMNPADRLTSDKPSAIASVFRLSFFWRMAATVVLTLAATAASPAAPPARPNVVFIMADDLGWADLGCYGNRFNETPHLDRLAKQGVRFTNFYAAAPVCSPTRAAILSGQYPARLGLTAHIPGHWRPFEKLAEPPAVLELPLEIVTIAESLKYHGYATAHFGKWHLGGKGFGPKEQGFNVALEFTGHSIPGPRQEPPGTAPRRAADYLAEKAIDFMRAQQDRPFFVQVHPFAVHIPLDTTPALQKKYEAKSKVAGYSCHPTYAGLLEELDTSVGKIMQALDELRLTDKTLIVFTSDNGGLERESGGWPGTSNRPLRNEKGSLYEGGIRIPTIVRWPNVTRANVVSPGPAISVDFFPTIVEATGAQAPPQQTLDGVSLLSRLREPQAAVHRTLFWHYPHYHHNRPASAIRRGTWKGIEFFDTGAFELYQLGDDLGESRDVAANNSDKVLTLRRALNHWRQEVAAQLPRRNPAYDPKRASEWWSRGKVEPTEAPGTYRPVKN